MNTTRLLRSALSTNALFSLCCAIYLLMEPGLIGNLIGWENPLFYQGLGLGLLGFAGDLIHQASRPKMSPMRALLASLADFGWVLGTIIILMVFTGTLSFTGQLLLASVAVVILVCGVFQAKGIQKLYQNPQRPELLHYCIQVKTDAPLPQLWSIIRDLAGIQRYAGNLASSEVLAGPVDSVGAIRQCTDKKGKTWREACTGMEHERSLSLRFVAEAEDFPFPAEEMLGQWVIEPITFSDGAKGTQVNVSWDMKPKPAWIAFLLMPMLQHQIQKDFPILLTKMAEDAKLMAEGKPLPTHTTNNENTLAFGAC